MTLAAFWTLDLSGNWSNGADWSTQVMQNGSIVTMPVPPGNGYDVALRPGGSAPFTVTYDTTATEHTLTGQAGSTLDITGGALTLTAFSDFSGAVQLDAGTLVIQNGWSVDGGFNETNGMVEVNAGVFSISTGTIGSIGGAGALYLEGGNDFTLAAGGQIDTGTLELGVNADGVGSRTTLTHPFAYQGTFELDNVAGNAATLEIDKHDYFLLQNTGTLDGVITGPGTFTVGPTATAVVAEPDGHSSLSMTGGAHFVDDGVVTQYQSFTSDGQLIVSYDGSWDFASDAAMTFSGAGRAINQGLIEKTGGTGTSVIQGRLINSRLSTILVDSGTIAADNVSNEGLISGPGAFVGSGIFNDDTGTIDVGALTLTGSGQLSGQPVHVAGALTVQGGNFRINALDVGTLVLEDGAKAVFGLETIAGQVVMTASTIEIGTLMLTGPASLSGVAGGSTIELANATLANFALYDGDTAMVDLGVIVQDGSVALGSRSTDHGTLSVVTGATYDMAGPVLLGNPNVATTGTQTITNAGLFEMAGSGTATVWHAQLTSTGTLAATGTLSLNGGSAALSGTLTGAGHIQLAESWTLGAGARVTVGVLENAGMGTLLGNVTDQGAFVNDGGATLALGGHQLILQKGGALGGTVDGAGTLRNPTGTLTLAGFTLGGGATLASSRLVYQTGAVSLGDNNGAGTLTVTHGVYDITGDNGIAAGGGASITNAGLFEKTGGTGTSVIAAAFSSSGTIEVTSGTLEFTGGFTSTGTIIGTETQSGGITFITAAALGAAASPGFLAPPDPAATLAAPALTDTGTLVPPPGDAGGDVAAWTTPDIGGAPPPDYQPQADAMPAWLPQQS